MTGMPKYISWPETQRGKGTVKAKMYSKEYQSFRFKGGVPEAWPGVEELAVTDKETAQYLVRNGVTKDMRTARGEPSRFRQPTFADHPTNLRGPDNPEPNLQYIHTSSIHVDSECHRHADNGDVYADREYPSDKDAFVKLPIELMLALNAPSHLRILCVLLRHAAMRSTSRLKLRRKMWEEAGVTKKDARSRAIKTLETKGVIRVERAPGNSPIVLLNFGRRGTPRLWKDASDLKTPRQGRG